jgi:hypothetical protein
MDEMTSDYEAQRFALMQAVSEQVILPSQLKALCLNKMMSDRHGQLPILGLWLPIPTPAVSGHRLSR